MPRLSLERLLFRSLSSFKGRSFERPFLRLISLVQKGSQQGRPGALCLEPVPELLSSGSVFGALQEEDFWGAGDFFSAFLQGNDFPAEK